ncbi:sirohydrochlorin chelatase [Bacillus cereus]|uniref:sirohydrochlorin chelatase n=1 Tax=Bacillus cereus group TaxID=86661 RepID=UPI000A3BFF42|nr:MULTISPECIES: sirohydrochlorin chelatase [Bacillus cereus group]MED3581284.1 sirohydrochlorin chelatase [Bacillus thuringiensis]MCU5457862.1 sirohydrochlorin chelatase [Bacillus cereus]MCU5505932.1 sirohydrochlorin chelatase [Bacillus cereus]MCU5512351.1 sirohydrochlorin chelatase [Bacillus cereus]MCU5550949.1 sirohydrochlorin chelatase [Bacillus cereus]
MKGIVYVGHGSRLQEGNEQFIHFIQSVMKERNERIQKMAFLELTTLSIQDAVTETIIEGATEIMMVPVLLFAAAHYKRDIPFEIGQMQKKYPHITFSVAPPFSTHSHMVELVVKRIRETMPMQSSSVLLVGRGSSDPQPIYELQQIGAAVGQKIGMPVSCSFLTKGTPSFTSELKHITSIASRVYVMPYLLFTGLLLQKIKLYTKKYDHVTTCNCLQFDTYMKLTLLERMEEWVYVSYGPFHGKSR